MKQNKSASYNFIITITWRDHLFGRGSGHIPYPFEQTIIYRFREAVSEAARFHNARRRLGRTS
jgi:hypothetical protein